MTDIDIKLGQFQNISGTIAKILKLKVRKTSLNFYSVMVIPALEFESETWVLKREGDIRIEFKLPY